MIDPTTYAERMRQATRDRVQQRADELSRGARIEAACRLIDAAMLRLFDLLAETDGDELVNVDANGVVLVPMPWGTLGRQYYDLDATQANILRAHMLDLNEAIVWDENRRRWLLMYPAARLSKWWTSNAQALRQRCRRSV